MKDLDPFSLDLDGTSLIEASAGTGKTYTLTTLYVRLLVERDLTPDQILVVTYTQAATAELRTRVRERILETIAAGEAAEDARVDPALRALALRAQRATQQGAGLDPLRRALQDFDEAAIFTIHGFCQRTLQQRAFESGMAFDAELIEQPEPLNRMLAHDLWLRLLAGEDAAFEAWLEQGAGRRWEFDPERLQHSLLRELGADEEMPILPAACEDPGDLAPLLERLRSAWSGWRDAWDAGRDEAAKLLLEHEGLHRGSYKQATIETRWLPALDQLARSLADANATETIASLALPDFWTRLTPAGIKMKKGHDPIEHAVFHACGDVEEAAAALAAAFDRRALGLRLRFVEAARAEARRRRDERHLLFFDDLLSELRAALRPPDGERLADLLRTQYPYALIDEFQDTDPVQFEIFETVWHRSERDPRPAAPKPGGLVLIGDPKQAIYSFRGADVYTYLRAGQDAADAVYGLARNWRSDPALISAVNALFSGSQNVFGIEAIGFHPVAARPDAEPGLRAPGRSQAGLRVLFADRERAGSLAGEKFESGIKTRFARTHLMDAFARDVADLLDSGATIEGRPVQPSDIAVLGRRKVELQAARRALEALGIPCVDRGDENVFDSREAWELLCVLRAWLRPADPSALRAALSTAAHALDARELAALQDDSPQLAAISERFADYARIWSQHGFSRAFLAWRRAEGVSARLLGFDDGDRRLTNWLHLGELLQRVATDRIASRAGLVHWLDRAISTPDARAEVGSEASLLRLERDDEAVSLVTLHRSKGLEYEIVYLPSLWEDPTVRDVSVAAARDDTKRHPPIRFHDPVTGRRTLDLGQLGEAYAEHVAQRDEEAMSEQLRLLYVGLTRAKRQCVIVWGAIDSGHRKAPLSWLLFGADWPSQGKPRADFSESLKKKSDDEWRAAWQRIQAIAEPDAITIEEVRFESRERRQAEAPDRRPLSYEPPRRSLGAPRITTSFSGLVRDGQRDDLPLAGPLVTGRDLDERAETLAAVPDDALRDPGAIAERPEPGGEAQPDLAAEMHAFPRGAEAGTLLHEVLECLDFSQLERSEVSRLAAEKLALAGFDSIWQEQVEHVVDAVAHTPLCSGRAEGAGDFCLADVASGQLRPEMEFTLSAAGSGSGPGFSPAALSELLMRAEPGTPLERYARRAACLGWRELRGYLRGFIDAVFFDGERYYLIDYKSNFLGAQQQDYRPENLVQPMIDHDYVLQYLIYTVALDRHLACRLADYQYDRDFGGAYYLFLRGLAPVHEPGCGIFFDRVPPAIVEAMSALLGKSEVGEPEGQRA